jgi:hypothetical protein
MAAVAVVKPGGGLLASVTRGRIENPPRLFVYSLPKVGKSGLAAGAPKPLFLCSEQGTEQYDVARFVIRDWATLLGAVDELIASPHDYQTLVLDTLDWFEAVLHEHIIAISPASKSGKKPTSIVTAFDGYGAGYKKAVEEFRGLAARLDTLNNKRRMSICLLAHAHVKKFNDPASEGWDQYKPKMHELASGFWKEWADGILYLALDVATHTTDDGDVRAVTTGERFIYTQPPRTAIYDAGTRWALPERMPIRWSALEEAIKQSDALRNEFAALVPKLPADKRAPAQDRAREAKDYDTLKGIVDYAKTLVSEEKGK